MRAILASRLVDRRPDARGLAGFLAFGAVQEPLTAVEGVQSLPPGCLQEIDLRNGLSGASEPIRRYWRFPRAQPDTTEAQAVERVRTTRSSTTW